MNTSAHLSTSTVQSMRKMYIKMIGMITDTVITSTMLGQKEIRSLNKDILTGSSSSPYALSVRKDMHKEGHKCIFAGKSKALPRREGS